MLPGKEVRPEDYVEIIWRRKWLVDRAVRRHRDRDRRLGRSFFLTDTGPMRGS